MEVAIAGGHGQIALRLTRLLAARGDRVRGLIRDPDQAAGVRDAGGEPVVCDLEDVDAGRLAEVVAGVDAVVFAAGAGPGSGAARKETVDYEGAVKLRRAAEAAGVRRYVMISAIGAGDPPDGDDVFSVYLRAKARADDELAASDLDWTILRPGRLTDEPGTGRVDLAESVTRGEVTRDDVAAVVAACLDEPRTAGRLLELVGGSTPIPEAVAAVSD